MPFTPQQILQRIIDHHDLSEEETTYLMQLIMHGELSPVMAAATLTGLRVKKESISEITAATKVMRELVQHVTFQGNKQNFVDIVGTGGDGAQTFNISTAAMFVTAAAGAKVAKHGNRSISSQSGSADVLEALGGSLTLTPDQIANSIEQTGIGFMFAPSHHPAMKHIAGIRKEMGIKTLFNILGPLTNPAAAPNQLIGVFHFDLVSKVARVLQRLKAKHVLVVHSQDGLDEISLEKPTFVGELKKGEILEYEIKPEDFGIQTASTQLIRVNNPEESKAMLIAALQNKHKEARDIVALNAGAALYAANVVVSIADGVKLALHTIENGLAYKKLEEFIQYSQYFK